MSKFEVIARWIHSDSDEPISEIEWLLREKYKTEKNLLKDYDDIIKEINNGNGCIWIKSKNE